MTTYADTVLADSPLIYLQCNEKINSTLADSSGNGNNAALTATFTLNYAPISSATIGAVHFSGGMATIPGKTALIPSTDYTIEIVTNFTGTAACAILTNFQKFGAAVGPAIYGNYIGLVGGVSPGTITFCDGQDTDNYKVSSSAGYNDGKYRHYVFCRRSNVLEIWVNGALVAQSTMPSVRNFTSPIDITLMRYSSGQFPTTGDLDEFAYYNYALSPIKIAQHFARAAAFGLLKGVAKLDSGAPASRVVARNWDTYTHVGVTFPEVDGSFTIYVPVAQYDVTVFGPAGYQPITHGPINAVAF